MTISITMTRSEAEDFLFEESRLLDEREFDSWLDLFTDDGIYWIPILEDSDPTTQTSILWDDAELRKMRVHQLAHERNVAQSPPSRTVHSITNVQVFATDLDNEIKVRCNLSLHEIRTGNHTQLGLGVPRILAGKSEYTLRYTGRWLIAQKKVILIERHLPIINLSFLV